MPNRTSRRSLLQSTGLLVAGSASPGLALLAGCAAPPAPMAETTMQEMTASDALSRIRSGKLYAEAYVGAMLDRAERLKGLDALISIDRDGAIAQAKKVDAMRASGAALPVLAGLPIVVKDNINTRDLPTTGGTAGAARRAPDGERADAAEADRRRRDRHRQVEPARARLRHHQHQPQQLRRPGEEPVRPDAHPGRLLRRHGGGDRRAHRPGRPRHRHRRLDPHSGRALRHRRPAPLGRQRRRRSALRRRRRGADQPHPRHGRADGPHRRRRRPARRHHHRRAADLRRRVAVRPADRHPGLVLGRARPAGRRRDVAGAGPPDVGRRHFRRGRHRRPGRAQREGLVPGRAARADRRHPGLPRRHRRDRHRRARDRRRHRQPRRQGRVRRDPGRRRRAGLCRTRSASTGRRCSASTPTTSPPTGSRR